MFVLSQSRFPYMNRSHLSIPLELYRAFGRAVDKLPETWRVYVLSSHTEFERCFGKTADKKRKLYNGMIKCDLFMYFK